MIDLKKVTIITITYNAEKYLEHTIKSVIAQDYKNIEYIIIDGESTDGTIDIIKKYEKHITYWISEPDRGIYDAMNKGIDVATGCWINFMNAGDTFTNEFILQKIFKKEIIEKDFDVLYGGVNIVDDNYNFLNNINAKSMNTIWKGSYCVHQSMFVKTSLMKKYKFNINYRLASEKELFIKLFVNKHTYKLFNFPVSDFIVSEDSFSTKHKIVDSIEMLYILLKYIDAPEKIFEHNHYQRLISYEPNSIKFSSSNNLDLAKDLNVLYDFTENISRTYKKIAIYGNSKLFKMINHIFINNTIKIYDKFNYNDSTHHPDELVNFDYDIILITVLGREEEIYSELTNKYNIYEKKIFSFLNIN